MIERFYLKDFLSFNEAELNFKKGLVVFSGPSGSGKSILMDAILSSFGLKAVEAKISESSVTWKIDEEFGIENDDINIFKQIKKEKTRYFINNQSISKKNISFLASKHLRHLSLKDYSDFENENLLQILDNKISKHKKEYKNTLKEYEGSFLELKKLQNELKKIEDEEKRVVELKEFARFEIEKIEAINPKEGEYEELMQIKKELSKKEKVLEAIQNAYALFEAEHFVNEALEILDEDSSFFDDCMNELRSKLDNAQDRFSALDEIDVEEVLDRLEALSELKRKYGGVKEAIIYKEKKLQELQKYENIEFEKEKLTNEIKDLQNKVEKIASEISNERKKEVLNFANELNKYLKQLYMQEINIELKEKNKDILGKDEVILKLKETTLDKISTGEFNRLRLAILAIKSEFLSQSDGVLILDEIDANLSGEESMSVAKVLKKLSKKFQIFVISHQPQLTSQGEQHFLVYKQDGVSKVKELNKNQRIDEIARIISGDKISKEAMEFAKELMK